MAIDLKYTPLTFLTSPEEVLKQIRNTVLFSFLYQENKTVNLSHYLESTQYGFTASGLTSGKHKMLRITDIKESGVNWDLVPYCNCDREYKYLLHDNDILIARTGGTTGKSFIVDNVPKNAVFASYLIRLRLKKGVAVEFVNCFLNSYAFWNQIIELKSGSALPNVNAEKLKKLKIPYCSETTQNEIRQYFKSNYIKYDAIKIKIDYVSNLYYAAKNIEKELEYQRSLVKQLRQAFLFEAMQGKLCQPKPIEDQETGEQLLASIKAEKEQLIKDKKISKEKGLSPIKPEEIPFEIPKDWVWCRLGDVIELSSGQDLKPNEYSDSIELGIPYITGASNLQNGKVLVNRWTNSARSFAVKGDLLLTCKGSGIGKMAYLNVDKVHIARQIMSLRSRFIPLNYIHTILLNNVDNFRLNAKSLIPGIDRPQVLNLLIPLPPLKIQNQIIEKLSQLMKTCDELETSIKLSQVQNEQLLQLVLNEALQIKKNSAQNIKLSIPENKKNFAKQVLGGKIISLFKDDPNFTHIKLQKLQYLSEHIAEADLGSNYYFQTAGPYDNKFMHSIAISLERSKWFKEENYRYYPLEKVDQIDQYYNGYFAPVNDKLSNLFNLLANATDTFSEIIATLYAVWNNRIIKKEELQDDLLIQDFYNWSDRKQQYTKDQLIEGLEFIRVNHIEPTGFGKELKRAKGK